MATMNGIDISSWQAGINIDKLTTTDFVIVKATGGTEYTNPYFTKHVADAIKAGKCVGAYHYARESGSPGSAADEAAYFVQQVRPYLGQIDLAVSYLYWRKIRKPLIEGPNYGCINFHPAILPD